MSAEVAELKRVTVNRRLQDLIKDRQSWEPDWKQLKSLVAPDHGRFEDSQYNDGRANREEIINSTAEEAAETLAAGIMAGVTSPARPWFRLEPTEPDLADNRSVKVYTDAITRLILRIFAMSNLYQILPAVYKEIEIFGTGAMMVLEDDKDIIRCYHFTVGDYFIGQSDRNVVDTMYRRYQITVWQAVQQFGLENVSDTVKRNYQKHNYQEAVWIVHAIEPNKGQFKNLGPAFKFPFISCYYEEGRKDGHGEGGEHLGFLRMHGFWTFPVMAGRWSLIGPSSYGKAIGHKALPDIKELQHHELVLARAVEQNADPATIEPSTLVNDDISLEPGTRNKVPPDQMAQIKPIMERPVPLNDTLLSIERIEQRINRAFKTDLFRMMTDSNRRQITAREIDERREEKLLQLGPALSRLDDDILDPLIKRVYDIIIRNDLGPEIPQELQGRQLRIEYISVLHQAQKAATTVGMERATAYLGNLIQVTGDPSVADVMDADQNFRDYATDIGIPASNVRDADGVAAIRQQRAQAQQAAQMAEQAPGMAQAAKTMSETDVQSDNPLTQILDTVGGPQ